MPTNVKVDDLKINKLTKAQYEAAVQGGTIGEYELSVLTDDDTYATSEQLTQGLAAKQDTISDLATIRSGAAAGATAVQPNDLATVATTGAYSDLSGTPTIPTVNNATLTITQGGTTKGTFTANADTDVTIDIDTGGSSLPSQSGNAGKFLVTDGTNVSWSNEIKNQDIKIYKTGVFGSGAIIFGYSSSSSATAPNNPIYITEQPTSWNGTQHPVLTLRAQSSGQAGLSANRIIPNGNDAEIGISGSEWTVWKKIYVTKINNGGASSSDITVPATSGTMVVADPTGATQGQVLTLDANLNAVWATPSGGGAGAPTLTWYTVSTAGNTLTIADTSSAQLVKVYKNGLLLQPTEDYSISGTTLTTVTAMVVGDKITTEVF